VFHSRIDEEDRADRGRLIRIPLVSAGWRVKLSMPLAINELILTFREQSNFCSISLYYSIICLKVD